MRVQGLGFTITRVGAVVGGKLAQQRAKLLRLLGLHRLLFTCDLSGVVIPYLEPVAAGGRVGPHGLLPECLPVLTCQAPKCSS